ncbi:related to Probable transport protein YPL264C [Hanseniaspora guilliermondii]|uniref:Related to Probable transport protein YPL264C n=1 Tax=Hanseniaspora guilliermondii TaxID=56406 RepID=A0A1L0B3N8_9ASCO|nr:related to Probable transport protein YPL264C [Hanseniaspora guilliermondii]
MNNKTNNESVSDDLQFELDSDYRIENTDKPQVLTNTNDNIGIYYLLVAQFFNTVMSLSTKLLVTDHLRDSSKDESQSIHPFEILFVRMTITLLFSYIYTRRNNISIFFKEPGFPVIKSLLCMRGFFGFFGVFGLYSSLRYLSISDSVSITFLTPLSTSVLAYFILKEAYYKIEAFCSVFALIGVLLITRPSFLHIGHESNNDENGIIEGNAHQRVIGTIYAFVGMLSGSTIYIIIKKIGSRADAILSVTYFSMMVCVISFFGIIFSPSLHFKLPNSFKQWILFANIGISGFIMQYTLTLGIQREKRTSRSSLIIYTQLIYGILWDVIFFKHAPDFLSIIGIVIILSCTLLATIKKQKNKYAKELRNGDLENSSKDIDEFNVDFELDDIDGSTAGNTLRK